jgi:hypothetical protein
MWYLVLCSCFFSSVLPHNRIVSCLQRIAFPHSSVRPATSDTSTSATVRRDSGAPRILDGHRPGSGHHRAGDTADALALLGGANQGQTQTSGRRGSIGATVPSQAGVASGRRSSGAGLLSVKGTSSIAASTAAAVLHSPAAPALSGASATPAPLLLVPPPPANRSLGISGHSPRRG